MRLVDMFREAGFFGYKLNLRIKGLQFVPVVGGCSVLFHGDMLANVSESGVRFYRPETLNAETRAFILRFAKSPGRYLQDLGRTSRACGVCGLPLSSEKCLARGIGRECWARYREAFHD